MQSKATTVREYLKNLPEDRRQVIEGVRKVILANIDKSCEEGMQYGMIGYYIPHKVFPAGYHCDPKQPLPFAALASQKNHMSLYLMCTYLNAEHEQLLKTAWAKTGKKLDMGKSCIRFKKLEDLALPAIADVLRRVSAKSYIDHYLQVLDTRTKEAKPAAKKSATRAAKAAPKKKVAQAKAKVAPKKR
ncbi:MAG: DUF1801 domain-containing protein [Planctomycetes bacterium]|nr:DUF1801 domain-containing protein [Planctomycetota bacterium]